MLQEYRHHRWWMEFQLFFRDLFGHEYPGLDEDWIGNYPNDYDTR